MSKAKPICSHPVERRDRFHQVACRGARWCGYPKAVLPSVCRCGSLLQQTVARYASLVPAEAMIAVVTASIEGLARTQLRDWPESTSSRGPAPCGAGVDLLLRHWKVFARAHDRARAGDAG